jgi:hypothetical protein
MGMMLPPGKNQITPQLDLYNLYLQYEVQPTCLFRVDHAEIISIHSLALITKIKHPFS